MVGSFAVTATAHAAPPRQGPPPQAVVAMEAPVPQPVMPAEPEGAEGTPAAVEATAPQPDVEVEAEAATQVETATPQVASANEPATAKTEATPPAEAPGDEAAAEASEDEVAPWVPRKEAKLMREHEVDLGRATYKPGKGLSIVSKNGRFALVTRLRAQFRYTFEHDGETDDASHSMQIRRARLQFVGHYFNEHNRYKVELAFSPRDLGFSDGVPHNTPLLTWYLEFDYLRDLTIRLGQYKIPYSRQRVISSGDLQLVDRALANGEFNLDRDIGIDVRSKDLFGLGRLRYYAGVYLGEGRDQYQASSFDLMYLGRVEVLPFGLFDDYSEADFERTAKPRLSIGAAYAFIDDAQGNRGVLGSTPTDGGTTDYHNVTGDFMFKILGLSLSGEVFYRAGERNFGDAVVVDDAGVEMPAPREAARNGLGWFGQGGFLIPRVPVEIAGRYSQIHPIGDGSALVSRDEAGGGLSWYIAQHPLKLQMDYFHQWDEGAISRGSDQLRVQLQGAF